MTVGRTSRPTVSALLDEIFRQQKPRIGRHQLFPSLAERFAAKLIFEVVHRRAAFEPLDERRHVFRRLFDPFLLLGSQLPVFVRMVDFGSRQADFRAAHSRQHLSGHDAVARHDTHLNEDSVCRGANVNAMRVVVLDPPGDDVNVLQQEWRSAGCTRMIERREFFISHNDDVRVGFLFVPLVGTRSAAVNAFPRWRCVQATATPHNTKSETAATTIRILMAGAFSSATIHSGDRSTSGKRTTNVSESDEQAHA